MVGPRRRRFSKAAGVLAVLCQNATLMSPSAFARTIGFVLYSEVQGCKCVAHGCTTGSAEGWLLEDWLVEFKLSRHHLRHPREFGQWLCLL
jgi:hypothetical protein